MDLNFKKWIDELAEKLDVSDDQLAQELETDKLTLSDWVTAIREEIEEEASEAMTELKGKLDELKLQLALGKAEAHDLAETQEANISKALADTRATLENMKASGEHAGHASVEKLDKGLASLSATLQTKFDIARLKASLGKAELMEEWEENKAELKGKWEELVAEFNETREKAESRGEELTREMGEVFDKARSVVQHFFRPEKKD